MELIIYLLLIVIIPPLFILFGKENKSKLTSHQIFEVRGIPVSGYEEDYLLMDEQNVIGMTRLLTQQGLQKISWQEATSFERREDDLDDHFLEYRKQYISRTGRNHPPVYKIRFEIKAVQLSEEEAEEFWKKQIWDDTVSSDD